MKKFFICLFTVLIFTVSVIFATENTSALIDDFSLNEVKVYYRCGGPVYPDSLLNTTLEYQYCTKDELEIKQIIEYVNKMTCVPSEEFSESSDGIYFEIEFCTENGISKKLNFDLLTKNLLFEGRNYKFVSEEYEKLSELIYSFRTKNDVKVYFDNVLLKPYIAPIIINDRTLISVQTLSEVLGAELKWNEEDHSVTLVKENNKLVFVLDKNYMVANEKNVELDMGGRFIENYGMVPVRALCEFFGYTVEWNNNCVYINSTKN